MIFWCCATLRRSADCVAFVGLFRFWHFADDADTVRERGKGREWQWEWGSAQVLAIAVDLSDERPTQRTPQAAWARDSHHLWPGNVWSPSIVVVVVVCVWRATVLPAPVPVPAPCVPGWAADSFSFSFLCLLSLLPSLPRCPSYTELTRCRGRINHGRTTAPNTEK